MKIVIIGAGNVAQALAGVLSKKGHEISLAVRQPQDNKYQEVRRRLEVAWIALANCAAAGDLLVLAVPWAQAQSALQQCGSMAGKILIDCTNPLKTDLSGLEVGQTTSAAELIAGWAVGAKVVKAFNHIGAEVMARAGSFASAPVMFICGNDLDAKLSVADLVNDAGFESVDAGELKVARLLEPLALLWINLAYSAGLGRNFAFSLLFSTTPEDKDTHYA